MCQKIPNDNCNDEIKTLMEEIEINHPLIIKVLKAVCQKNPNNNCNDEIKIKICFIYSILIQTRWYELSLLQRVFTVLLIEGGTSKKVGLHNIYIYIYIYIYTKHIKICKSCY